MNTLSSLLEFIGNQISDYFTTKEDYQATKAKVGTIAVKKTSVSSLPITITSNKIHSYHAPENLYLTNPSAMKSVWTITPADGSVTISGTISGTTDIEFDLEVEVDNITG